MLNWAASIQYKNGSGWLTVDPSSGVGNATLRLDASAAGLTVGSPIVRAAPTAACNLVARSTPALPIILSKIIRQFYALLVE